MNNNTFNESLSNSSFVPNQSISNDSNSFNSDTMTSNYDNTASFSSSLMDAVLNYTLNVTQNFTDGISISNSSVNSEFSDVTYYNPIDSNFTNDGNITSNWTINNTFTNSTEVVKGGCELLGNFGYAVQGILGIMCFTVLVCK